MQVYVQTSTRTTFPRRLAAVNGGELSHSVALLSEDNSPSLTDCAFAGISLAGVILCIGLLSSAKVAIEAMPALASMAASISLFAFIMLASHLLQIRRLCVRDLRSGRREGAHPKCAARSSHAGWRSGLNAARISSTNSFGCSQAAKCVPLSSLL